MAEKIYDLELRTFIFARDCRFLLKKLPKTIQVTEDGKQLIRSSGSVGAIILRRMNPSVKKIFITG